MSLREIVEKVTASDESWANFLKKLRRYREMVGRFFESNPDVELISSVISSYAGLVSAWKHAAEQGWYISTLATFSGLTAALKGGDVLDQFMIEHLRINGREFVENIVSLFPEREEIIRAAMKLHEEGNYVASVPLFLIQADGICAQRLGVFFFTEHGKRKTTIEELFAGDQRHAQRALMSALTWPTQLNAPIKKSDAESKKKGPNRSGIIHGSRKHLDYATEINSLKAMSFMFFIGILLDPVTHIGRAD